MSRALTRYWFTLDYGPNPYGPDPSLWCPGPFGMGVTAYDEADAVKLVRAWFDDMKVAPGTIITSRVGVDVRTLDRDVRQHMGPPNWRGVWYPRPASIA